MGFDVPLRQPVDLGAQFSEETLDRFVAENPHNRFPVPAEAPALDFDQWAGQGGGFILVFLKHHVCAWLGVISVTLHP